jgi:hypothetical protein
MTCKKVKYFKRKDAEIALAFCNVCYYSGQESRQQKRIYWCKLCKSYHLTSKKNNNLTTK